MGLRLHLAETFAGAYKLKYAKGLSGGLSSSRERARLLVKTYTRICWKGWWVGQKIVARVHVRGASHANEKVSYQY